MAVGDVVSGQASATNVAIDFQPAAGVTCIVTSFHGAGNSTWLSLYDGALTSLTQFSDGANHGSRNICNLKIAINNTRYFRGVSNGYPAGFTGIQIQ